MTRTPAFVSSLLGVLLVTATPSLVEAACRPSSADALSGDLSVRAQVLVAPQAAVPYVVVRCHLSGSIPDTVWVPVTRGDLRPQAMTIEAWDRLWEATAPRAIERGRPSAAAGEVPEHDLDPPVAAVLGHPEAPVASASVTLVEPDASVPLPEGTGGLVVVRFDDPASLAAAAGEGVWTPWIRLPLDAGTAEEGAPEQPALPVLPESELVGEGSVVSIETTLLLLGDDTYWAIEGFDIWDAVDRRPGALAESAAAIAPNPVLVVPDVRVSYRQNRSDGTGFDAFYERRIAEVAPEPSFPVAILQYAGGLGRREALLPQPEPLEWYTAANRIIRLRLDHAAGHRLPLAEVPPVLLQPVFVTRPVEQTEAVAPTDPADLELSGDALVFGFGAEQLGEMTPTMVRRTIEQHTEDLMACDPSGDVPVPVDLQLMVEPGGTTVAVFVGVDPPLGYPAVNQCLIDAFTDVLFPLATGSPVGVRFPIVYQQR